VGYQLGIDIGSAHTIVGITDGGWPRVLELGGQRRWPSVVYAPAGGGLQFARAAARRARTEPDRTATDLLRRLGDDGQVLLGGAAYSREGLLGRFVAHVVTTAADQLGGLPDQVVVTHPTFWPASRREAFAEAVGQLSGLEMPVVAVPAADAMGTLLARASVTQTVDLVGWYDLGAGFLDTAVLSFSPFGYQLVGTAAGMRHGAGIDLDGLLADRALELAGAPAASLDRADPAVRVALARLRRDVAQAKEVLAEEDEVDVPVTLPGFDTTATLTRAELETMVGPTIDDTVGTVRRALRSVPAGPADLSRILLSGGISYLPLVSRRLRAAFPEITRIEHRSDADLAMGAAILAADLADRATRAGGAGAEQTYDTTALIRPPDAASLSSLPPYLAGDGTVAPVAAGDPTAAAAAAGAGAADGAGAAAGPGGGAVVGPGTDALDAATARWVVGDLADGRTDGPGAGAGAGAAPTPAGVGPAGGGWDAPGAGWGATGGGWGGSGVATIAPTGDYERPPVVAGGAGAAPAPAAGEAYPGVENPAAVGGAAAGASRDGAGPAGAGGGAGGRGRNGRGGRGSGSGGGGIFRSRRGLVAAAVVAVLFVAAGTSAGVVLAGRGSDSDTTPVASVSTFPTTDPIPPPATSSPEPSAAPNLVRVAGSSEVAPITETAYNEFRQSQRNVTVSIEATSTEDGFEALCSGKADLADASFEPNPGSLKDPGCAKKLVGFEVAHHTLPIVVNPQNTWLHCLTLKQVRQVWGADSSVTRWNQIDPSFPDEPVSFVGPPRSSVQAQVFNATISDASDRSRSYQQADLSGVANDVAGNRLSIGYLDYPTYETFGSRLRGVEINNGEGCIAPTAVAVGTGLYLPLCKPLYIYARTDAVRQPATAAFLRYFLENGRKIAFDAHYVPRTDDTVGENVARLEKLTAGVGPVPA